MGVFQAVRHIDPVEPNRTGRTEKGSLVCSAVSCQSLAASTGVGASQPEVGHSTSGSPKPHSRRKRYIHYSTTHNQMASVLARRLLSRFPSWLSFTQLRAKTFKSFPKFIPS